MQIGDVAQMKSCKVYFGTSEYGFKAKDSMGGDRLIFLFLGSHNSHDGAFDVDKALIDMGWTPPPKDA